MAHYYRASRGAVLRDVQLQRRPYGVWVFESGKFVKPGDGGYINWAYVGYNAMRTYGPDTMTFSKP